MARPMVVLVGDSVVHESYPDGFTGHLAAAFKGKADVLHRGYPFGVGTTLLLEHMDRFIESIPQLMDRSMMLFIMWFQAAELLAAGQNDRHNHQLRCITSCLLCSFSLLYVSLCVQRTAAVCWTSRRMRAT
mmetsp:Transcript_7054/g.17177  ORF Transcript_7054/g.17177 Transcript_7054/m.17177 type:complete len:131 (+) Transcript_7054:59-451(+)